MILTSKSINILIYCSHTYILKREDQNVSCLSARSRRTLSTRQEQQMQFIARSQLTMATIFSLGLDRNCWYCRYCFQNIPKFMTVDAFLLQTLVWYIRVSVFLKFWNIHASVFGRNKTVWSESRAELSSCLKSISSLTRKGNWCIDDTFPTVLINNTKE